MEADVVGLNAVIPVAQASKAESDRQGDIDSSNGGSPVKVLFVHSAPEHSLDIETEGEPGGELVVVQESRCAIDDGWLAVVMVVNVLEDAGSRKGSEVVPSIPEEVVSHAQFCLSNSWAGKPSFDTCIESVRLGPLIRLVQGRKDAHTVVIFDKGSGRRCAHIGSGICVCCER